MVNYNIKGTGLQVTDELRTYAEKKLGGTEKFISGDTTAHVDVEFEFSQMRDGPKYRAEFTLVAKGGLYRAEEWGSTLHEAIDLATDALVKELRRTKKKNLAFVRRGAARLKDLVRGLTDRF